MLSIRNLHARVSDKPILKGINLEIGTGEIHPLGQMAQEEHYRRYCRP